MKTSTIVWTLAVLIVMASLGAYFYLAPAANAPTTTVETTPNPSGSNLPAGDMAPVPTTPIASTSANINASTTVGH